MSDGGGESERRRENEKHKAKRKFDRTDEFAFAIAKIAVAQVCESAGFQTFQLSTLETLSDIVVRCIQNIGKSASFYANLAGRGEGNVFDVLQGLEDLGAGFGFAGASDIGHCLSNSGVVREIIQYVNDAEDIPFAYSLPQIPVIKGRNPTPTFLEKGEEPPGEHIPAWLPTFPDPETYAQLSAGNEKTSGSFVEKNEINRYKSKAERPFLNLQQHFACNGASGLTFVNGGDAARTRESEETNPYLAAPLHFGEKEVSSVSLPVKLSNEGAVRNPALANQHLGNHVSVLETFAPAIVALKSSFHDSEDGQKNTTCNPRPAVNFKIGVGKKSLGKAVDLTLNKSHEEKIIPWFEGNTETDEKKRRAEKILKESMENSEEPTQL